KSTFVDLNFVSSLPKTDRVFMEKFDPSKMCNYCQEKGHWKLDCPVLKNKCTHSLVKPSVSAAPVLSEGRVTKQKSVHFFSAYSPFITEGCVSLVGGKEEITIKIERHRTDGLIYFAISFTFFLAISYWRVCFNSRNPDEHFVCASSYSEPSI
ncbi:MAG: hypothetical protein ACRCZO_03410, partial [Cetobacterium sp.]